MFRTLITTAFAASVVFSATACLAGSPKPGVDDRAQQDAASYTPATPSLLDRAVNTLQKYDNLGRDPLHPTYRELSNTGRLDRQVKREQQQLRGY